jgi:hypothetical protein
LFKKLLSFSRQHILFIPYLQSKDCAGVDAVKCLRCGRCCTQLDVMIINPKLIRTDGTVDSSDAESMIKKPAGIRCPHLLYRDEVAVCTIHNQPFYRGTPCDRFEQFGPDDGICVMGNYLKNIMEF